MAAPPARKQEVFGSPEARAGDSHPELLRTPNPVLFPSTPPPRDPSVSLEANLKLRSGLSAGRCLPAPGFARESGEASLSISARAGTAFGTTPHSPAQTVYFPVGTTRTLSSSTPWEVYMIINLQHAGDAITLL